MKRIFTLLVLLIAFSAILQAQTPWKFIVYGDTRTDDAAHRSVLQSIAQNTPDYRFIINVGDCINAGSSSSDWNTWHSAIDDVLGTTVLGSGQNNNPPQYMAVAGNHEELIESSTARTLWAQNLPGQITYFSEFDNLARNGYFDYQNARFILLYSETDITGSQLTMMKEAIDNNPHPWLFAIWHKPVWPFGTKGYESQIDDEWAVPLYQGGCDIIFTGHAHYYARSKKVAANGSQFPPLDSNNGVTQIITGDGGAPPADVTPGDALYMLADSRQDGYGYCELEVNGTTLNYEHLSSTGSVVDAVTFTPNTKPAYTSTSGTIDQRIAASADDAEENLNDGSVNTTGSSDIELAYDGTIPQTAGLRFTGLTIPQGATITNAYIQFSCKQTGSSTANLTIKAEDSDDAAAFTTTTNNITTRTTTSASVSWSPAAWNIADAATTNERTPNISSVIQEVVNRSGWTSGNDMALIVTGTGTRTAWSYSGRSTAAASLHVEYTTGGGTVTDNKVKFLLQGDTQKIVNLAPNTFYSHMDNTLTNVYTKDADLYMHMGDITEDDLTSNWEVARTGIYKLDGKIPYVLNVGNNDGTGAKFVSYFPLSKYNSLPSFVSNYNDHRNVAHQYTFGGVDWLVISLWRFPGTAEISWAEGLIDAHPDKNVVIVNHTQGLGDGDIVWNMVKRKPNVHFMFLGHNLTMHEMLTADDGHPVGRVQTCWHSATKDHYYCVAELDVNAGSAAFKYYSPVNANTTGDSWTWTGFDFGTPVTTGTNGAQFVSYQNVPATMTPGETVSVSVTMKNTGTTTWTQGALYKLGSVNDNMDFGTNRVQLSPTDNIAPGQNKIFTFDITAPTTPGNYNFQWKMVQDLVEWFGDASQNVSVVVSDGPVVNDLTKKLMMGYQGWFLCEGDQSSPNEWRHWYKSTTTPSAANLSVDMWPDMSEYTATYNTQMTYADGSTAKLFSSHDLSTTRKHFEWMRDYNIHGVYLQRFLGEIADPRFFSARNNVLQNVMTSAAEYDRGFSVMYDISGVADDGNLYNKLITDWEYLVDNYNVLNAEGYVKQDNRPVVAIWGIGFKDRGLTPATFEAIIDYFHNTADPKYRAYVMGGVPDGWRTLSGSSETAAAWADIYNSLDMISPWTVGRYNDENTADNWNTNFTVPDIAACNTQGIDYMPVIWPGFSWVNLHDGPYNQIPRNGGNFYWNQAYNAISSGAEFVYVAMFDEVDESTAMFKLAETTADLPVNCSLVPLDADGTSLPSDWYLQLADQTQQMLDGTIALTPTIPITPQTPGVNNATFVSQSVPASMLPGETVSVSITMNNSGTTTWTQADLYKLGSLNDNTNFGTNRVQLSPTDNIAPGQSKTFTFGITAPTTPGTYNFQWKMVQDLVEWFGGLTDNVVITVEDTVNYLDDCDALIDWNSSASLSLNATDNLQGAACIEFTGSTTDEFKKVFTIPYNSGIPAYAAVLQFSYYVSDASLMGTANQVELGSGGQADVNEFNWNLSGLQTGWNQISLNISDAGGSADLNAINWFRIYNVKSGSVTTRIDGIKIIDNGNTPVTYALTVNSGTGDGSYEVNAQVNISADAAPAGQEFDAWVINSGSPTIADANAASTTLTMPASAVTLTASYKDIVNRVDHTDSPIVAITRRAEINSTEGAVKAFDNTTSTKWLDNGGVPSTSSPSWIQIRLVSAAVVDELTIASANDVPDRDPQDFVLKGSNNGSTYTTLGSWTNQTYTSRFQVKAFTFNNETAYSYYRLEITKNLGNLTMTQLSEIQLIGPEGTEPIYLDDCDALTNWNTSGSNTLTLSSDYLQGAASLKIVGSGTDEFKKAFSTPFNSGATAANGVLKFWYYVDDVSKLSSDGQVEIGSGGAADVNEYHWGLRSGLVNGWNEVSLNISEAGISGGTPNLSAINWFRIYHSKSASATIRIDAIQLFADLSKSATIIAGTDNSTAGTEQKVNIYPNPLNQDLLTIHLTGFVDVEQVELSISNLMGQIVYSNTINSFDKVSINTAGLFHGSLYLVTVKSGKTISTTKLIVK